MRKRITLLFALASLQLTLTVAQTSTPNHYVYFADGAVEAAKFLEGKPAGLYKMQNLLEEG